MPAAINDWTVIDMKNDWKQIFPGHWIRPTIQRQPATLGKPEAAICV
jgi:hypothetical protein